MRQVRARLAKWSALALAPSAGAKVSVKFTTMQGFAAPGTPVEVDIRGERKRAEVVTPPFL